MCLYVYTHLYIYVYTHMYIHIYGCVYICIHISVYTYIRMCIYKEWLNKIILIPFKALKWKNKFRNEISSKFWIEWYIKLFNLNFFQIYSFNQSLLHALFYLNQFIFLLTVFISSMSCWIFQKKMMNTVYFNLTIKLKLMTCIKKKLKLD